LLRELGQLTVQDPAARLSAHARLADTVELARARQLENVAFAARLFFLPVGTTQRDLTLAREEWEPGWRALSPAKHDLMVPAGRALATLFLLCTDGLWRPARQCHREHLDLGFLDDLKREVREHFQSPKDMDGFLTFLGVCTWSGGLLLIEGGIDGVVPPQRIPPALI